MLFNSLDFAIFLPLVFLIYWFCIPKKTRYQNAFLLLSSYVFYGWWDWRFLALILGSSLIDYFVGLQLVRTTNKEKRKQWLVLSLLVNLGALGFFKYFNFFAESLVDSFSFFGSEIALDRLDIILPVGISFYTFQSLSYSIDVYRNQMEPTKDWLSFLCYVSFFPQLVAGPIERARNLLPQFYTSRFFNYEKASDGMRQMLWGFFKKIVIADNCARYVNIIFSDIEGHSGSTLFMGAILFSFQIYGDFSGYSDIAIGGAKLFGFDFKQNFAVPYFSRNIAEFWRRWHISLSTWFRDYLYIPLGGSKASKFKVLRNIFIVFLVSGLWHGANWTFVVWGLVHALLFVPLFLFKRNRAYLTGIADGRNFPSLIELSSVIITFVLVSLSWVFFRANSIQDAFMYFNKMSTTSIFSVPQYLTDEMLVISIFFIGILLIVDWQGRNHKHALEKIHERFSRPWRYVLYYVLIMCIFLFGAEEQPFIYFQF